MPLPALLTALPALFEVGAGIYGMTQAKKIPPYLQEAIDRLERQADTGLGPAASAMRTSGRGRILRNMDAMQARGASALASRGTSSSSAADSMIRDVNKTAADSFATLENSIAELDTQIKQSANQALAGVMGSAAGVQSGQMSAAGQLVGKGVASLFDKDLLKSLGVEFPLTEAELFNRELLDVQKRGVAALEAIKPVDMNELFKGMAGEDWLKQLMSGYGVDDLLNLQKLKYPKLGLQ